MVSVIKKWLLKRAKAVVIFVLACLIAAGLISYAVQALSGRDDVDEETTVQTLEGEAAAPAGDLPGVRALRGVGEGVASDSQGPLG